MRKDEYGSKISAISVEKVYTRNSVGFNFQYVKL